MCRRRTAAIVGLSGEWPRRGASLQAFIWLPLLSTYCCLGRKSPNNKQSLLPQFDQPALLWVYSAEPQYPTSSTSILSPLWLTWGTRSSWKTAWTPAWTTCLATGLSPSLKPPYVSHHRNPHAAVKACPVQLAKKNAKAAQRLHEVDKLAEQRRWRLSWRLRKKKKQPLPLWTCSSLRHVIIIRNQMSQPDGVICMCVCVWVNTKPSHLHLTLQFQVSSQDCSRSVKLDRTNCCVKECSSSGTYYGPCRNIWKGLTDSLDVQPFIAVTDIIIIM